MLAQTLLRERAAQHEAYYKRLLQRFNASKIDTHKAKLEATYYTLLANLVECMQGAKGVVDRDRCGALLRRIHCTHVRMVVASRVEETCVAQPCHVALHEDGANERAKVIRALAVALCM